MAKRKAPNRSAALKELRRLRQARTIIAIAATGTPITLQLGETDQRRPQNFDLIARLLRLPKDAADRAEQLWNEVNGADDATMITNEAALERIHDRLEWWHEEHDAPASDRVDLYTKLR